jgi:hypothetical protein
MTKTSRKHLIASLALAGVCTLGCLRPQPLTAEGAPGAEQSGNTKTSDIPTAAYSWKNVTILGGGFVTGVIFSPVEKNLVYARTDVGGAYRFNAADKTWIALTDHFGKDDGNLLGIESIAADPMDANKVYMAVGTYTQSWATNGAMLRSSDRGNTWQRTNMPIKMGGNENGRANGERLAVDPNLPSTLFFGSRKNGMWKSTDSGATWNTATFPITEEPLGVGISFVLFDRRSGARGKPTPAIYAGVASTEAGLYRSTDAGATWKPVPGQPKGVMPSHADFDSQGGLYLSYGNLPGPSDVVTGAIWKYDPKANAWKDISPAKPNDNDKFGYGGLSVDAKSPGTLMVTTIDRWTKGDEIFRTTDGGAKWVAIGPTAVRDAAGARYLYWDKDKPSAAGWMGDIDIDPFNPDHVFYITGQGIWQSTDATAASADKPTHWVFQNRGLEETVVQDLASPPSGPPLLSGVGDICGFRHDDLNQPPSRGMFNNPIFGGTTSLDFAELKPELVVRVGNTSHGGENRRGAYSTDQAATWTPFASEPAGSEGVGNIAISADGSTIIWVPRGSQAHYSRDRGTRWTRIEGLPKPGKTPDWAPMPLKIAADRANPKKFYAYDVLDGRGYASVDGGVTFTETDSGLPQLPEYGLLSGSIQAVPGKEGHVWLSTGKELYHSNDAAQTFDTVSSITESYGVGFGKAPPGKDYPALYTSAKVEDVVGIFRSDDAGENWIRINDDQHQFGSVWLLIGDPRVYGRVYVGTGGRGIVYGEPR